MTSSTEGFSMPRKSKVLKALEVGRIRIAGMHAVGEVAGLYLQVSPPKSPGAYPTLGNALVRDITLAMVLQVLEPVWTTKTETASRVQGRIASILDWATVRGYRDGPNPARWKGNLDTLLAKPSKVAKPVHHPA